MCFMRLMNLDPGFMKGLRINRLRAVSRLLENLEAKVFERAARARVVKARVYRHHSGLKVIKVTKIKL